MWWLKRYKLKTFFIGTLASLAILYACTQQVSKPEAVNLPAHFPAPRYNFANNPCTEAGIALGKKIFYDPIFSRDSTIACASCHKQSFAFADGGQRVSSGILGRTGLRNAPPIFNLLWSQSFMWDGGVNHIEVSGFAAIKDTLEMGEKLKHVIEKMQRHPLYPALFKKAFGSDSITSQNMFRALTQFTGGIVSAGSKYDRAKQNQEQFSNSEQKGYTLFRQHCNACHTEPLFTSYTFRNNGIKPTPGDSGRQRITQLPQHRNLYKVPSLRNVAFTAPYMHNGSIQTLSDVLRHYTSGIIPSETLDPLLQRNGKTGIELSAQDQLNLLAFLHTLSDSSLLLNPALN